MIAAGIGADDICIGLPVVKPNGLFSECADESSILIGLTLFSPQTKKQAQYKNRR